MSSPSRNLTGFSWSKWSNRNVFGNEDLQKIVNEFAFEKFDGFQLEQMVQQECIRIRQRCYNTSMSFFTGLADIFSGVSSQKFNHDLGSVLGPFAFAKHLM